MGDINSLNLLVDSKFSYGKCPKISNTLKFRTPNIFAQNNFWKCPKISNSSSFAKRGFLKFRTQLSSSNFLLAHSNFGNFLCSPKNFGGAYSRRFVRASVRPCVRASVRPCVRASVPLLSTQILGNCLSDFNETSWEY